LGLVINEEAEVDVDTRCRCRKKLSAENYLVGKVGDMLAFWGESSWE
jgi:hypothetical protein